LTQYN